MWSSPNAKDDDVLKKFDDVTSHLNEGKSLKRKYIKFLFTFTQFLKCSLNEILFREERSGNTLYQELSFQEPTLEESEITGNWVHPGEFASSGKYPSITCCSVRVHFITWPLSLFSDLVARSHTGGDGFSGFFFFFVLFMLFRPKSVGTSSCASLASSVYLRSFF